MFGEINPKIAGVGSNWAQGISSGPLGTPLSGNLVNCTGYVITSLAYTTLTGLGTGVATLLGTPTFANLSATITGITANSTIITNSSGTLTASPRQGDAYAATYFGAL
jgi:hypothetical protein